MIGKLKKKFVLINMSFVTIVLLIVFGVFLFSNWQHEQTVLSDAMRHALERGSPTGEIPKPFELGSERKMNPDNAPNMQQATIFTVTLAEDGVTVESISSEKNVTVSEETAQQAVSTVLASGKKEGKIPQYALQYMKKVTPSGVTKIAFADLTTQNSMMGHLLLTSFLVGIGGLLAFLFISLFLADWALKPVKQAWMQQKQFIADASHELKTPLTVILANTDILLAHPNDTIAQQEKWIAHTRDEAQHMKGMVEDMLFLARSDASPEPKMHSDVDVTDTAWSCLLPFEPVAFEKGVELESVVEDNLHLLGDAGKLKQLMAILLDNACKYAGEKGKVTFTLDKTADKVRICVNNTGDAIAPEHLPHLFERFYRTDKARARTEGGYGLGLSIAERIVTEHRGRITVESDSVHGTTFTVLLPSAK